MQLLRNTVRFVAVAAVVFAVALLAPLLIAVARTWSGRLFGGLLLAVQLALAAAIAWPVAAVVGLVVAITLAATLWLARPPGRLTLETDFIRLAVAVVTRFDPFLPPRRARVVRRTMSRLLAEMDADPAYRDLPPGFAEATRWAFSGRFFTTHRHEYVPPTAPTGPLPVVVFLHGHGPNSALFVHVWRPFCDAHGVALVAPSFGYGNWDHADAAEAVRWVLDNALPAGRFDRGRVYLVGLSQGGCGVGRAGAALADRLAGLVFLSGTTELDVLGSPTFVEGWRGRPVLVVQGGQDRHVRARDTDAAVARLRRNGAEVTYHLDPDADHFLFFSRAGAVHRHVAAWMGLGVAVSVPEV